MGSELFERLFKLRRRRNHDGLEFEAIGEGSLLELVTEGYRKGVGLIAERDDAAGGWQNVTNQLYFFAGEIRSSTADAGDVSRGMGEVADDPGIDCAAGEDNGNGRGRLVSGIDGRREVGDEHVDFEPDQFGGECVEAA